MKREGSRLNKEYFLVIFLILFGILLYLIDSLGLMLFVRRGLSFTIDPIAFEASRMGVDSREYLDTFVRLKDFREEYNKLSIDIYEKEVENSFYILLKEENESLKKQISLGGVEQGYIMAKVLGGGIQDHLSINKGASSGVAVGDIVVWGNMYVGIVSRVDTEGALIRLATNKSSNLEVIVVNKGIEASKISEKIDILTRGVVKGSSDGIKIENMSMSAEIKNGDVVVVNDTKVGEYLVLGYLVGISENPAATSRSGYVSPIYDYDNLMTVFVKIDF